MLKALTWLALASAVLWAGMAQAAGFDPKTYDAFKPGQTTKAEVRQTLGTPTAEMPSLNQHTTLIYQYDPAPGAGDAAHPQRLTVVFLFDPDGRFVRYRVYASPAEAAAGDALAPTAPAAASAAGGEPAKPAVGSTQFDASEAVGLFCVPVLIAGRLPSQDLIKQSRFTPGGQEHAAPVGVPSFHATALNGDVVEVFANEKARACNVHIHGAATAIDAYRAAMRAQNWRQIMAPNAQKSGVVVEGWRVNFDAPAGAAAQVVVSSTSSVIDLARPQVAAVIIHLAR